MSGEECAEGSRLETCPECHRLFCGDIDHKICNECKGGYRIINGKLFVMNKERFAKQKDYKIKV